MDKTICKNWELNFQCANCGLGAYNTEQLLKLCNVCGGKMLGVNPIKSREYIKEVINNES